MTLGSRLLLFTWRSGVVEFVKEVQKYFLTPLEICTHQTECISWHLTDQTSMKVSGHSKLCKCFCFQLSCTRFCLPEWEESKLFYEWRRGRRENSPCEFQYSLDCPSTTLSFDRFCKEQRFAHRQTRILRSCGSSFHLHNASALWLRMHAVKDLFSSWCRIRKWDG